MRLKGKTALIAGAARNNGKAIALKFAAEGADLVLVAKTSGDDLKKVAQQCEAFGVQTLTILADVARSSECNRLVAAALERFGKVDVLVSVAATRPHKFFWEFSDQEWHDVLEVSMNSTFYLARALVPGMIERRSGSIIALGGKSSLTSHPKGSAVVTSKHGLYGLIKSMAHDLGPHNVRANLLALAHIENDMHNPEWFNSDDPKSEHVPLRRRAKPEEAANAALFLASDESSYVTGDRLLCAGGRYM